jgi:hypothetical protein
VVNIGDQLHPRGTLDKGAYQVIGEVFKKVEAVESYFVGAEPLADIAVLLLPETEDALARAQDSRGVVKIDHAIEGAAAALASLKYQWNGETPDRDNLSRYQVVIIPDRGHVDDGMKAKLERYIAGGGAILFSHEATLDGCEFALSNSPVHYKGKCPYTPSYMRLTGCAFGGELGVGLPDTEFVNYQPGSYVEARVGARAFGEVWQPYFNRAPEHFSSHAQTPADKPTGHPVAVVSTDSKIAYLYAAAFTGYREDAFYLYKEIIGHLLARLLPAPLVKAGPSVPPGMEIALLRQPKGNRLVAQLVNFTPTRRTAANEFIEAAVPVHDVTFAVRTSQAPARVYLAPQETEVPCEQMDEYCWVTLPVVVTSQAVVFEF